MRRGKLELGCNAGLYALRGDLPGAGCLLFLLAEQMERGDHPVELNVGDRSVEDGLLPPVCRAKGGGIPLGVGRAHDFALPEVDQISSGVHAYHRGNRAFNTQRESVVLGQTRARNHLRNI